VRAVPIVRSAKLLAAALSAGLLFAQDHANASQDRLDIDIYLSYETDVCGPNGYPSPCRVLSARAFEDGVGRRFRAFRSGIVIPPATIQWQPQQLSILRQYEALGPLDLSRRMAALVVFRWEARRPAYMQLRRSTSQQAFEVRLGAGNRVFYHLPLQFLNPTQQDEWVLKTNLATYRISFSQ